MPDTHGAASLGAITAAEIQDEVWLEVARQHAVGQPPRPAAAAGPSPAPAMSLPDILALDGAAFIEAAYAAVLGRPADTTGLADLSAELAGGADKTDLLLRLQSSPEGQLAGRALEGLQGRSLGRRLRRIPVVGKILRLGVSVLRRSGLSAALAPRPRAAAAPQAETQARLGAMEASLATWRRAMEDQLIEHRLAVDNATRRMAVVQAAHEDLGRKMTKALGEQARGLATLTDRSDAFARQLAATEDSVIESLLAVADSTASHDQRLAAVEGGVDLGMVASRINEAAGNLRAELDGRVIAAEALAEANRQEVAAQQRRIGLMLHALRDRVPASVDAEDDHTLDELYLQFEDRFRGSRADIKERQRTYLPRLRAAAAGRPILDIGAGRGEFLELLRDEGIVGRGVDTNVAMVAACRDAGMDCVEGDALTYLAGQPAGSLGAVTGFHIVEHVPFKVVVRIMDEALRALAPGGIILFETPNPANILTASRYFYLDPTHRNPLPGEMMAMIAEARGFVDAEVVPLHPMAARFPGTDRQLASALDAIFHGPQDYALIARRP